MRWEADPIGSGGRDYYYYKMAPDLGWIDGVVLVPHRHARGSWEEDPRKSELGMDGWNGTRVGHL